MGFPASAKYASIRKVLLRTFALLAVLWVVACIALYGVMRQPPERFGRVMAKMPTPVAFLVLPFETLWMRARAGSLHVGDHAPDFSLTRLDKSAQIRLSSLVERGHPIVLIFGSYT